MPEGDGVGGTLEEFTWERTVQLLKESKKTDSGVVGDPPPHLIR